jgi:lipopolysaccharide exporter
VLENFVMSVQSRMARGAVWMFAARWADKLLGLVSTLVLARLLAPGDFGIVAIATAVIVLLEVMTNFSFDTALIQHRSPTREHYDTVWTIGVLFGAAVSVAMIVLAYPLAMIYKDPRLIPLMLVFAANPLLNALRNVGVVDFRRNLQFHKEFLLNFIRRIVSLPVALGLAFWLQDYWALVLGSLFTTAAGAVLTYVMHPFRPRSSLAHRGELIGFSKWMFLSNLFQFLSIRFGDFIIGKFRGPHELGLFSMASEFGSLPWLEIAAPINRAAFPGYSRLAADHNELMQTFLRVFGLIAAVVIPSGVGIALTAPMFVPLLLGPKWLDAIPLVQLMALAATLIGLWTNLGYVFMARGQPQRLLVLNSWQAATTVGFLIAFLSAEVPNGAGWAFLTASATLVLPNLYLLRKDLRLPWLAIPQVLWRPLFGSAVMAIAVLSLRAQMPPSSGAALQLFELAAAVAVGAAVYCVTVLAAWRGCGSPVGAETFVLDRLLRVLRVR